MCYWICGARTRLHGHVMRYRCDVVFTLDWFRLVWTSICHSHPLQRDTSSRARRRVREWRHRTTVLLDDAYGATAHLAGGCRTLEKRGGVVRISRACHQCFGSRRRRELFRTYIAEVCILYSTVCVKVHDCKPQLQDSSLSHILDLTRLDTLVAGRVVNVTLQSSC